MASKIDSLNLKWINNGFICSDLQSLARLISHIKQSKNAHSNLKTALRTHTSTKENANIHAGG